jgi:hypothetical protein
MQKAKVQKIVNEVYPKVIKDFGPGKFGIAPIELHRDIYARLSGNPDDYGEDSKKSKAEFDDELYKIYIYYPNMKDKEDVIRSILHEHSHSTQDPRKRAKYRQMGYKMNPHEIEARKAEDNWKKYK